MFDDSRVYGKTESAPSFPPYQPKHSRRNPESRSPQVARSFTPTRAIVVLVHGTFVPGAPWTRHGSTIREAIERQFQGQVEFRVLLWPGRVFRHYNNTHRARRRGAERLQRKLHAWARAAPTAAFYVVAHSHGGTLALYALSRDLPEGVDGLVCLATPFIASAEAFDDPLAHALFIALQVIFYPVAIATTLLSIGLLGVAYSDSGWWVSRTFSWLAAIPLMLVGGGMLLEGHNILRRFFDKTFGAWRARHIERTASRLVSVLPAVPLFCLTTRRHDEARKALRFAGMLRRMTTLDGITSAAMWIEERIPHREALSTVLYVTIFAGSSLGTAVFFAYKVVSGGAWMWAPFAFLAGLILGLLAASLACVALIVAIIVAAWVAYPLLGVIRLITIVPTMVGFGFWNAWAEYLLMLSPDGAPEGFEPRRSEPDSGLDTLKVYDLGVVRGLLHSALYQDAGAVHDVAVWLRVRYEMTQKT